MPPGKLHRVPDDIGEKFVPFYFQNGGGVSGGDGDSGGIQEICRPQAGTDVEIQSNPHVSSGKNVSVSGIVYEGPRPEAVDFHLPVKLLNQGPAAARHPAQVSVQKELDLLRAEEDGSLAAEAVPLDLLFQTDVRGIAIVVPYSEFLPPGHAVKFLPQGRVPGIVEVQAPDLIASVLPVAVPPGRRREAGGEDQPVGGGDLVLPLVPRFHAWAPFVQEDGGIIQGIS